MSGNNAFLVGTESFCVFSLVCTGIIIPFGGSFSLFCCYLIRGCVAEWVLPTWCYDHHSQMWLEVGIEAWWASYCFGVWISVFTNEREGGSYSREQPEEQEFYFYSPGTESTYSFSHCWPMAVTLEQKEKGAAINQLGTHVNSGDLCSFFCVCIHSFTQLCIVMFNFMSQLD